MKKLVYTTVLATLLINLSACGTILYPERKGQRAGRIDVGVAVLDGIGLLFFLVPGVIAYAVDFATGTIYLPGGRHAALDNPLDKNDMLVLHVGKENLSRENIERVIYAQTGKDLNAANADVEVYKLDAEGKKEKVANPIS